MNPHLETAFGSKPDASEYSPEYGKYISLVPGNDVVRALEEQIRETLRLVSGCSEEQGEFRYAADKWSMKEMLGHVIDTERIFTYRALRFSRNDKTPIEGFEQDGYVKFGPFRRCKLADLVDEFAHVRAASVHLFRNLDEEAWMRRGIANGNEISVRALAYTVAGHELHHRKILQEKYLAQRASG